MSEFDMTLKQRITAFVQLSEVLKPIAANADWPGYQCGIVESEYNDFKSLIPLLTHHNGWFTPENVRMALGAWSKNLSSEQLNLWLEKYPQDLLEKENIKNVGLVLAGNIPMVGFHDVLSVLISGHRAVIKLSSDDKLLIPAILHMLCIIEPEFNERILLVDGKLQNIDSVIATGSNNTSRYFEQYFAGYPHIIRGSRNSLALVDESTDTETLKKLGHDIFDYFGLGCRNVSHVMFSEGYPINRFFEAIYDFHPIVNHNKYANNYDYYKAIFLLNKEDLLDNGFLILRKNQMFYSPLGTLHYQFYKSIPEALEIIESRKTELQCVVDATGKVPNAVLPGETQKPALWDYADGIDTIKFLLELKF
jgi:hypothetical protein